MKTRFLMWLLLLSGVCTVQAQCIKGPWNGKLKVGTTELPLVFHFEQDTKGEEVCVMDSPAQGAKGIQATINLLTCDSVSVSIPMIGAAYQGKKVGEVINGNFTQGGMSFPLELKAGKVIQNRPQTPRPPFPYQTEEVTFVNGKERVKLAGTLTYPVGYQKECPVSVVLMITGSGQQNRDEELFGHKPFAVLADYLARNGIASLRYDDRGVGDSEGNPEKITTLQNMEDALAGVKFLKNKGGFSRVGVLGHSEGGLISFMLGGKYTGTIDFIVSMAGTAVRGDRILLQQNYSTLLWSGIQPKVASDYCKVLQKVFAYLMNQTPQSAAASSEILERFIKEANVTLPTGAKENLLTVLSTSSPWINYFLSYDPSEALAAIRCPVMAINGTLDTQVSAQQNLDALRRLLSANPSHLIKEYKGLNHLFQSAKTGLPTEYGTIEETISEKVLSDIAGWIRGLQ